MLTVAARADVPPFHVMDVLSAAAGRQRTHGDVISLAAGQPSSPAPWPVRKAAAEALNQHALGYTEQLGIPELRQAIAGHYKRQYDLDVTADDVVVTTGSSGAFTLPPWTMGSPSAACWKTSHTRSATGSPQAATPSTASRTHWVSARWSRRNSRRDWDAGP